MKHFQEAFSNLLLPMSTDQLDECLKSMRITAEDIFTQKNKLSEERLGEFYEEIEAKCQQMLEKNAEESKKACTDALKIVFGQLLNDAQHQDYGGYEHFISAKQNCKEEYFDSPFLTNVDKVFVQTLYDDYIRRHIKSWEIMILWADKGIDDQRKRQEEERLARQEEEQKNRDLQQQLAQVRKQRDMMEQQYEDDLKKIIKNNISIKQKESKKITDELAQLNHHYQEAVKRREEQTMEKLNSRIETLTRENHKINSEKVMLKIQLEETKNKGIATLNIYSISIIFLC